MFKYINYQSLTGRFNRWQIYHSPPGFANTNSNIESFNATFKRDFTKRRRQNIKETIELLAKMVGYYSSKAGRKLWLNYPKFNKKVKSLAKHLVKSQFKKLPNNKYKYLGNVNSFIINLKNTKCFKDCSCNCYNFLNFLKHALCFHIVAFSRLFQLDLFGKKYLEEEREYDESHAKFVIKTKRGKRKNQNGRYKNSESAKVRDE